VESEFVPLCFFSPSTEVLLVDSVPAASHWVHPTVALIKPVTWANKAATKGKGVS